MTCFPRRAKPLTSRAKGKTVWSLSTALTGVTDEEAGSAKPASTRASASSSAPTIAASVKPASHRTKPTSPAATIRAV